MRHYNLKPGAAMQHFMDIILEGNADTGLPYTKPVEDGYHSIAKVIRWVRQHYLSSRHHSVCTLPTNRSQPSRQLP
jgi:hypothetical protein